MPAAGDKDYMQNLIFEDGAPAAGYDPDETQSQDGRGAGRGAFTPSTFDQDQAAFMCDQVGMDLDGFPLDHEFPKDYGQEEEDECDIKGEPLFEDELANQADWAKQPKRKSKRRHTRLPRTSFFASVGETLGKTPRRAPNKSIQRFGFVSAVSFLSARSFRRTKS
ncbi:Eyes absent-like protein 4 [Hordeum vulgare]|nr:Eyes absent-like protein 4 [Hordeum vulgare]